MVIIRVWGGIGNQMFQYALYKEFLYKGTEAKLDISIYEKKRIHNGYELQEMFHIEDDMYASKRECSRLAFYKVNKLSRLLMRIPRKTCYTVLKEKENGYDEKVLNYSNCYLEGYFQSERYFDNIRPDIRNDFIFRKEKDTNVKKWEKLIKDTGRNSVSIHIRRGDYVTLETNDKLLCNTLYYEKAIEYMSSNIENPIFFIFSNDIDWCKNKFSNLNCYYVTGNKGASSAWDMYLMSCCSHNIIANSSFSWWGAWLNNNDKKVVVAPKVWSSDKKFTDIIPDGWIVI